MAAPGAIPMIYSCTCTNYNSSFCAAKSQLVLILSISVAGSDTGNAPQATNARGAFIIAFSVWRICGTMITAQVFFYLSACVRMHGTTIQVLGGVLVHSQFRLTREITPAPYENISPPAVKKRLCRIFPSPRSLVDVTPSPHSNLADLLETYST